MFLFTINRPWCGAARRDALGSSRSRPDGTVRGRLPLGPEIFWHFVQDLNIIGPIPMTRWHLVDSSPGRSPGPMTPNFVFATKPRLAFRTAHKTNPFSRQDVPRVRDKVTERSVLTVLRRTRSHRRQYGSDYRITILYLLISRAAATGYLIRAERTRHSSRRRSRTGARVVWNVTLDLRPSTIPGIRSSKEKPGNADGWCGAARGARNQPLRRK